MSAPLTVPLVVEDRVPAFLKEHDAEGAFRTLCDVLRESYPDLLRIEAKVFNDFDLGFDRVQVSAVLPADYSIERAVEQSKRFHEQSVNRLSAPQIHLFCAGDDFASE